MLLRRYPCYTEIIGNGIIAEADAAGLLHRYPVSLDFGFPIHVGFLLIVKILPLQMLLPMT